MLDTRAAAIPRSVYLLAGVHALLVGWCCLRYGFAWTEVGLLPAGVLDWRYGSFDVYRVSPPLVRMWAALPALAMGLEVPFSGVMPDARQRAEWEVARAMLDADPAAAHRALALGRLACLPLTIAGMLVAARWAGELYGRSAAVGAALVWNFFPYMIGYGCLISGDAQAASMGLVTFYVFHRWLEQPQLAESYLLGLVLGLTLLTKTSWLILLGLLPLLWLTIRAGQWWTGRRGGAVDEPAGEARSGSRVFAIWLRQAGGLAFALLLALFVVNLLYGFGGSFRRLDDYEFISQALAGSDEWKSRGWSGNRFDGTLLGAVPVPLPENLVVGVDLQKWDFDRTRWSYFRGQWRDEGWWYYYLYGLATKLPLGFWLLVLIAAAGTARWRSWRGPWPQELLLWTPMVLVVLLASMETGLNRHLRYVLPSLPPAIVLASRSFRVFDQPRRRLRGVVVVATAWMIASSLWIYPHSLSYFNESVGGPMRADAHFNASNLDWGQDLPFLRRWQQANPDKQPLWVKNYLHVTPPESAGIETAGAVPSMYQPDARRSQAELAKSEARFKPGWYAVDRETQLRKSGDFEHLRQFEPSAWAGYGFQIFEITPQRAEVLERQWRERLK